MHFVLIRIQGGVLLVDKPEDEYIMRHFGANKNKIRQYRKPGEEADFGGLGADRRYLMITLYLDVCCLCRPFDNQEQYLIRQEADSVQEILAMSTNSIILAGSEMIDEEIFRIGHSQKREMVIGTTQLMQKYIPIDEGIKQRTRILRSLGFHAADAIHIACAEKAEATFITTDKQLLQTAEKNKQLLHCSVFHPTIWLMEHYI